MRQLVEQSLRSAEGGDAQAGGGRGPVPQLHAAGRAAGHKQHQFTRQWLLAEGFEAGVAAATAAAGSQAVPASPYLLAGGILPHMAYAGVPPAGYAVAGIVPTMLPPGGLPLAQQPLPGGYLPASAFTQLQSQAMHEASLQQGALGGGLPLGMHDAGAGAQHLNQIYFDPTRYDASAAPGLAAGPAVQRGFVAAGGMLAGGMEGLLGANAAASGVGSFGGPEYAQAPDGSFYLLDPGAGHPSVAAFGGAAGAGACAAYVRLLHCCSLAILRCFLLPPACLRVLCSALHATCRDDPISNRFCGLSLRYRPAGRWQCHGRRCAAGRPGLCHFAARRRLAARWRQRL